MNAIGKLLKYIPIGFTTQALSEHMNTVMLEYQTANLVETSLGLIGLTDDVVENEVHIPPGQLETAGLNVQDDEPLGEEVLPIKILVDRHLHVVHEENIYPVHDLTKLYQLCANCHVLRLADCSL